LGGAASGKAGVRRRRASRRPDLGDDASSLGRVNCKLVIIMSLLFDALTRERNLGVPRAPAHGGSPYSIN